jgi:hypothetical protein
METGMLQAFAWYTERELSSERFRSASAMVVGEKFEKTLPFLDGAVEYVSDTTAV